LARARAAGVRACAARAERPAATAADDRDADRGRASHAPYAERNAARAAVRGGDFDAGGRARRAARGARVRPQAACDRVSTRRRATRARATRALALTQN